MRELQFTNSVPEVWNILKKTLRTGWVMREVENPETVAEHILSLRVLGNEVAQGLSLKEQDTNDLLDMLEVHDFAEYKVGDLVILGTDATAVEKRAHKHQAELRVIQELSATIPAGKLILELWERFHAQEDDIARLGYQLDKLQAIEQAHQYEQQQNIPGLTKEFLDWDEDKIIHPYLKERIAKLKI